MVTSNRLSALPVCPPKLEGWTPIGNFALAKGNDNAPQVLAKGLPQGSFCQQTDSFMKTVSYFVRNDATNFVNLLFTPPKVGMLVAPPPSDEEIDAAIALIASRRHPEPGESEKMAALDKNPPPIQDNDYDVEDWKMLDGNLTPSLVTLIRHEMKDSDNILFRQADKSGESYFVTKDVEKLERMEDVLIKIKRDLTAIGQLDVSGEANQISLQLVYIIAAQQSKQLFLNKPKRELMTTTVTYLGGVLVLGMGFHIGGVLAAKMLQGPSKIAEWIRNNRKPPSAGAGGAGASGETADAPRPDASPSAEFSLLDDRVDAGEGADFQNDPTRSYDPIQHVHINGTAIAVVVVAGGVILLVPEIVPFIAMTSPEAVSLATWVGVFAASH